MTVETQEMKALPERGVGGPGGMTPDEALLAISGHVPVLAFAAAFRSGGRSWHTLRFRPRPRGNAGFRSRR